MGIQEWIAGIAIKKAVGSAIKLVIAMVSSVAVTKQLESMGVTVNPIELEAALTVLINSGLKVAQNYLKVKYGWKWLG